MKKEYKAPIICIHTIQTENLLQFASKTETKDNTGGSGTDVNTSTDQEGTSKQNSGLMDWDDEEW